MSENRVFKIEWKVGDRELYMFCLTLDEVKENLRYLDASGYEPVLYEVLDYGRYM